MKLYNAYKFLYRNDRIARALSDMILAKNDNSQYRFILCHAKVTIIKETNNKNRIKEHLGIVLSVPQIGQYLSLLPSDKSL